VVVAVVPRFEAGDVKVGLRVDGVVKRGRFVVEQFGRTYREIRDRRGVNFVGCVSINVLVNSGSTHDLGTGGGGEVNAR
jgi:hypothetical protein